MKIPSNYTEEETVAIIQKVINKMASRYTFAHYELEDVKQEAFLIVVESCLPLYDEKRPLENFLTVSLNNRLKNFKRNKYFRQETGTAEKIQNVKKKLAEPGSIDGLGVYEDDDFFDNMYFKELVNSIDLNLPPKLRGDYLKLRSGVKISRDRKNKVHAAILEIIRIENGDDRDGED